MRLLLVVRLLLIVRLIVLRLWHRWCWLLVRVVITTTRGCVGRSIVGCIVAIAIATPCCCGGGQGRRIVRLFVLLKVLLLFLLLLVF